MPKSVVALILFALGPTAAVPLAVILVLDGLLMRVLLPMLWAFDGRDRQPWSEVLRQIAERTFAKRGSADQYAKIRAASAFAAGLLICAVALLILYLVYPSAELFGSFAEIGGWRNLIGVALANSVVLIMGYLAVAALIWGIADATTPQPRDLADEPLPRTDRLRRDVRHAPIGRDRPRGPQRVRQPRRRDLLAGPRNRQHAHLIVVTA